MNLVDKNSKKFNKKTFSLRIEKFEIEKIIYVTQD